MRRFFQFAVLVVLVAVGFGCGGGARVRHAEPGNMAVFQGQSVDKIYFMPFNTDNVTGEGDIGSPEDQAEHKARWFIHLAGAAQMHLAKKWPGVKVIYVGAPDKDYLAKICEKHETTVEVTDVAPASGFTLSGAYISENIVSGTSRALLGAMQGASSNIVHWKLARGGDVIYNARSQGQYMGGGFSWGYEGYGVNDQLGIQLADVLTALHDGEPVLVTGEE